MIFTCIVINVSYLYFHGSVIIIYTCYKIIDTIYNYSGFYNIHSVVAELRKIILLKHRFLAIFSK
jgi:hypothetical protein